MISQYLIFPCSFRPHCCARRCPGAPITIEAGTYGEEKCPNSFLCAEILCLAGVWSVCCSFDVNRRMIKSERNLLNDPTENRVNSCIGFFSEMMGKLWCLGCCVNWYVSQIIPTFVSFEFGQNLFYYLFLIFFSLLVLPV
jgi:hypothetical protein